MARTFRVLVCALLVSPASAFAQRFDDIGVRAQGMGGAFVAVADDASATWWNSAGLAHALTLVDLSSSILEDGGRSIALAFPSLGISYYHLKISELQPSATTASTPSDRQINEAAGSDLSAGDFGFSQFGVTVGQSITQHFVVATTIKLVNALSDTQADVDVGTMLSFGKLRAGVTVRDLRQPTFGVGNTFQLARRARAGVALIETPSGLFDRIVVSADSDLMASTTAAREERDVAAGAEIWWRGRVAVRGGGGINTTAGGGSFGAFGLTVVPYRRLNVEGAVTRASDSTRDRWSLGLRLTF